ncbi:MAG TPA: HAMP domain-containing protein, partial [Acidimicrobiales bacterium]
MRRYLALTAAATTSMVVLAFTVPLAVLVRDKAGQQAVARASLEAQSLVSVLTAVRDPQSRAQVVERLRQRTADDITLYLPDGTTVGVPAAVDAGVTEAMQGKAFTRARQGGRDVLVPVVADNGQTMVVRVGVPASKLRRGLARAYALLALVALSLLGIAIVVADRLARFFVRPIDDLAATARTLEAGDLQARAAVAKPVEVAEVGNALNRLAQRILDMIAAEREALADMSHRLRTPLTALRLEAESITIAEEAARFGASVDELAAALDDLIAEARRPSAGPVELVDLADVVAERARFWSALADEQERPFVLHVDPGELHIAVSRTQLVAAVDA